MNKDVALKIVEAAALTPTTTVLEVGPGLGVLTHLILPKVGQYFAVELDPRFVKELNKDFGANPKVKITEGDILKINISDLFSNSTLAPNPYTLISNLPYNITSPFFKKILTEKNPPERMVIMIQHEVAERVCLRATSHEPRANLFGLMCNLYAECEYLLHVSRGSFNPPPKVESAVVCLKPYSDKAFFEKWGIERLVAEEFIAFTAVFFKNQRKMMSNAFGKSRAEAIRAALVAINERPDARPADLSLKKWVALWKISAHSLQKRG